MKSLLRGVLPMCRFVEIQGSFHVYSTPRTHTQIDSSPRRTQSDGRQSAMKRSFRAATVFTGAAACAVGLAPTAHAAPAAPGATAKITPAATANTCNPYLTATHSVHLYYEPSENHPTPACIYGIGITTWGHGKRFEAYCAGWYSGYMSIHSQRRHFAAGRSTHLLYGASVTGIDISRIYASRSSFSCLN